MLSDSVAKARLEEVDQVVSAKRVLGPSAPSIPTEAQLTEERRALLSVREIAAEGKRDFEQAVDSLKAEALVRVEVAMSRDTLATECRRAHPGAI